MKDLTVAISAPIFPNVVQTYILSQIVAFKRAGLKMVILSAKCGDTKELPPAIGKYKLLNDTSYINTEPGNIIGELFSLPLKDHSYNEAFKTILKSKPWQKYGWRYFIKELILAKALTFRNFDIIHSHSLVTSYQYLFFRDLFSKPIVTTFHGKEPRSSNNLPRDKARVIFDKGDAFLVNTLPAKNQLLEMGCPEDKITIIPQGTNLEDFPFRPRHINREGRIILLTVGRLSIEKGHHVAIKAVAELANEFPTLEYHMVGSGPEKDNLLALIDRYGLKGRVKLLGLMTGDQLKDVYSTADLFVLPSIDTRDGYAVETQGVVLQEAQASGIPVVGSRTGGIPDVIRDNETGILYNESDHHNLADKIRTLIEDTGLYQKLCQSGRKEVESRFDTNLVGARIISLYEYVLENSELVQQ